MAFSVFYIMFYHRCISKNNTNFSFSMKANKGKFAADESQRIYFEDVKVGLGKELVDKFIGM